ncbi:MAG: hypothetical protein JXR63_13755 [Spirochaetales bacterium]|nr:hypothetical protein [Spirochaetales bacterium]
MSDVTVVNQELSFKGIFNAAFKDGFKNFLPVFVNVLLWGLTIWIPYLNVGTTIGLVTLAAKLGRGESLSMTEIFNPVYRKKMGEFFLVNGFVRMGIAFGMVMFIIPGYVIAIAWSLASLLVVDKDKNAIEAIRLSNDATYGKKWTIFGVNIVLGLIFGLVAGIISGLLNLIHPILGAIALFFLMMVFVSIMLSVRGYIYNSLVGDK